VARLRVSVVPRAAANAVGPFAGGQLRVRVTRPPADGEANQAVMRIVAEALGLRRGDVRLVTGERSRRKLLEVDRLSEGELAERLDRIGR
jgi:uncharacterized protein (TIGR00251 family)